MAAIAPIRLTGVRPGIVAMLIDHLARAEWLGLRERMELKGETRQFLTGSEARLVVAVACTARLERFGLPNRIRLHVENCGIVTRHIRQPRSVPLPLLSFPRDKRAERVSRR